MDDGDFAHASVYRPIAKLNLNKELGDGRIDPIDYEMFRQAERQVANADISGTSLSNITVIDLLSEVIRRQWRQYNAIQAVKRIPVAKLQIDIAVTDKFAASKKVPPLVAPDQKSNQFTQVPLRLWKNMVDLFESDESRMKGTIEPLNFEIDTAAGALAEAANEQIITEQQKFTDLAGSDWGTVTSGHSANNPGNDIEAAHTVITNNHFRPDTICMAPKASVEYTSNDFVRGHLPPGNFDVNGTFELPLWPGIKAVVDPGYTATEAILFDSNAMLLGEGPTVAEQFRDPHRSADGWVIRQWLEPKMVTADAGRTLTGVTA
jgi:hypothetical protein